jgi:hypothetical protein
MKIMSGIFTDLYNGIRRPEVIMNSGPTPSPSGLPGAFNAQTDARINYGSTLLGDVQPYAYGQPTRLADQTAFMAIPHKVPKIIPELRLPEARATDNTFSLSHSVDDGDVAFSLRVNRAASSLERMHTFDKMEMSHTVDPQINLATVNYLLAGIQRYWNKAERVKWQQFMIDVNFLGSATSAKRDFTICDAIRFVTDVARPFGIVIGSEKQGGTHEGSLAPVTFPVNFITTLAVCGRVENLVHMWREYNISAGDDLIFHLEYLPICSTDGSMDYVLNHWRKNIIKQRFDWDPEGRNYGWQLVPAVYSSYTPSQLNEGYDYRDHGYWHICRTQVMRQAEITQKLEAHTKIQRCYHDDSRFMRGGLIEVTFEPHFVRYKTLGPKKIKVVSRVPLPAPPAGAATTIQKSSMPAASMEETDDKKTEEKRKKKRATGMTRLPQFEAAAVV